MALYTVFRAFSYFLYAVRVAIFLYCILSWIRPNNRLFYALEKFVMPFVMPFRRLSVWLTAKLNVPLDFSCWFSIIALTVVERLMWQLYGLLIRIY